MKSQHTSIQRRGSKAIAIGLALFFIQISFSVLAASPKGMVKIKGGAFTPFFEQNKDGKKVSIEILDFYLDIAPVTNSQYFRFLQENPKWGKAKIKKVFAERSYLKHWRSGSHFDKEDAQQPVRYVSWFAAAAYCESLNKELPTVEQWEYAASADDVDKFAMNKPNHRQKILDWYGRPSSKEPKNVKSEKKNYWGIYDLHGLVWEWTLDYNTSMVTGESREDSSLNRSKFCGSGSLNAKDKSDYAAFMRFGFRSSLKGDYTVGNLGFRCAKELEVGK